MTTVSRDFSPFKKIRSFSIMYNASSDVASLHSEYLEKNVCKKMKVSI